MDQFIATGRDAKEAFGYPSMTIVWTKKSQGGGKGKMCAFFPTRSTYLLTPILAPMLRHRTACLGVIG